MTQKTALVLGATGGIGSEVARRLFAVGWTVRAMHRDPARIERDQAFTWVRGDAMRPADVVEAAEGADLIVHAVNPPGYRKWGGTVLPMLKSSIAAARESSARILLPGTVYNYGPDVYRAGPVPEDAPQNPVTRKGCIRARMEERLRMAADEGIRCLIVRAGDFFGPRAGNNWFSQGLVKAGKPVRAVTNPGAPGVGHQWAYLPDVAETMVRLVEREKELPRFASVQMAGHWDADGTAMVSAIARAAGRPGLKVRRLPWPLLGLLAPFVPLARELREMRYLWQEPLRLDNARLTALLGPEPHTPLDVAVRATLTGLGCLTGVPSGIGGMSLTDTAPAR